MRSALHGGPAVVDRRMPGDQRDELAHRPGGGVIQPERHRAIVRTPPPAADRRGSPPGGEVSRRRPPRGWVDPHHHPDVVGALVAGVALPGVGLRQPLDQLRAALGAHADAAADLDVAERVVPVQDQHAGSRVLEPVGLLLAALDGGQQQLIALVGGPQHRSLRGAVGVAGGHHHVVGVIEQLLGQFRQCGHARSLGRSHRPAGQLCWPRSAAGWVPADRPPDRLGWAACTQTRCAGNRC